MSQTMGSQSIQFEQAPYIQGSASIVGTKEGEGPLGKLFDVVGADDKFGEETWEDAESTLQKEAATLALGKADLQKEDIRYIFGGDLLGQNIATTFGLMELYGYPCSACTAPVLLQENPCPLGQWQWQPDMGTTCWPLPPATLPVRRNSFAFPWSTPTKGPYQLPGRSQAAEPLYLGQSAPTCGLLESPQGKWWTTA